MNEIFNHIDIKVDWGILLGLISVLSLLWTWIIKNKNHPSKDIGIQEVFYESFLDKPNELNNDIRILLNGEEIEQINKIELYLTNIGNRTININDFYLNPTLNLSGYSKILSVNIFVSNEFTTVDTNKIDSTKIELLLQNFEPKNYLKIILLFESIENDVDPIFSFHFKEDKRVNIGLISYPIVKSRAIFEDINGLLIFLIPFFATLGLTYFIVRYGLGINMSTPSNFSIGWKFLFYSPPVLLTIFLIVDYFLGLNRFHWGYKKIKEWHQSR